MKLTQEAAKQTFCIQLLSRSNASDPAISSTCIASDCMAWRWCNGGGNIIEGLGYCGLARKPEDKPS